MITEYIFHDDTEECIEAVTLFVEMLTNRYGTLADVKFVLVPVTSDYDATELFKNKGNRFTSKFIFFGFLPTREEFNNILSEGYMVSVFNCKESDSWIAMDKRNPLCCNEFRYDPARTIMGLTKKYIAELKPVEDNTDD